MMIQRLLITGRVNTGKSLLLEQLEKLLPTWPMLHTDDTQTMPMTERIPLIASWFNRQHPWIIAGVIIPHALRLWFQSNQEPPVDCLIFLFEPKQPLTKGQEVFSEGVLNIYQEVRGKVHEPDYPLWHCGNCVGLFEAPINSMCPRCGNDQLTPITY